MSLVAYVDKAMRGRCIMCNRRLPKAKIPLYHAFASHWEKGMVASEDSTVEVCVCGPKCYQTYSDGKDAA